MMLRGCGGFERQRMGEGVLRRRRGKGKRGGEGGGIYGFGFIFLDAYAFVILVKCEVGRRNSQ